MTEFFCQDKHSLQCKGVTVVTVQVRVCKVMFIIL